MSETMMEMDREQMMGGQYTEAPEGLKPASLAELVERQSGTSKLLAEIERTRPLAQELSPEVKGE